MKQYSYKDGGGELSQQMSIAQNSQSMMKQYSYKDGGMLSQQMNNKYVFIVPAHNETVFMAISGWERILL